MVEFVVSYEIVVEATGVDEVDGAVVLGAKAVVALVITSVIVDGVVVGVVVDGATVVDVVLEAVVFD